MPANAVVSLLQHVRGLAAAAPSDEQLLADYLARRSDEAFAALLGRHGPMVLNVCRRILHDAHAAEDAFQATFLVLADRAAAIQHRASLAGFLHRVAYRQALRARRRRMQDLPAALCDRSAEPAQVIAWKEMLGILDHELGQLSDRYRAPLVLCHLQGRTQDEAARQLGWSLNTLRRRLARARRLLEARLRGRGVTLPAALAGLLAASAVAVPDRLRAATLAAAGARAVGTKLGTLLAVVALGAAVCLGLTSTPPVKQVPAPHPFPAQGTVRLGTARYRHGSRIESFAVSADGKRAAVASGWGSFAPARVFDLTDGRCLCSLPHERGRYIEAVGLSPDGKVLVTKHDKDLCFRDAATGKELRRIPYVPESGGGRSITDWLTFSPDGKQLAVTLLGSAVCLIDVETGKVTRTFDCGWAVSACVFSPDGKRMAAGGYEQEKGPVHFVRIWDVGTGKVLQRFPAGGGPVRALAFSPDGARLAGGGWRDGRLRLWESATGKEVKVFPRIGPDIEAVAFSPDGKSVAATGDRLHLYDPATFKERFRIDRRVRRLAFSPDGSVLTGAVSGAIYRWDAATGRPLTPVAAQDSAVEQILVSPDGRKVFTTGQDGDLHVWDTMGGKPPRRIAAGIERGVVASPDGRFLAWAVADESVRIPAVPHMGFPYGSRVRLYDVAAGRVIDRFPGFAADATVAGFLPDSKTLLTLGGGVAAVRFWDVPSGKERRSFKVSPRLDADLYEAARWVYLRWTTRRAALSPDGKTLAIGRDRGTVYSVPVLLWDVATGKAGKGLDRPLKGREVPDEAGSGQTTDLGNTRASFNRKMKSTDGRAFSPDGRFLADWAKNPFGPSRMDHVHVWEVATGRAVAALDPGRQAGAANAAFAPDGRTLAVASAGGVIRLWEAATWKVRAEFRGHRDGVTALAFGPDGRLFSGGLDTVVLARDVRPPRGRAEGTLASAWEALGDPDGKAGFQAQGRFLAEPGKAVDWFTAQLTRRVQLSSARVKALIADLDADDLATRDRATAELEKHWSVTAGAVRAVAAQSASAEARRRAEIIVRRIERSVTPPEELRALRAVEVLEWLATREALTLLRKLARGDDHLAREAAAACKRLDGRR